MIADDPARVAGPGELPSDHRHFNDDEPVEIEFDAAADYVARVVTDIPPEPTSGDWLRILMAAFDAGKRLGFTQGFSAGQRAVTSANELVEKALWGGR